MSQTLSLRLEVGTSVFLATCWGTAPCRDGKDSLACLPQLQRPSQLLMQYLEGKEPECTHAEGQRSVLRAVGLAKAVNLVEHALCTRTELSPGMR